MDTVAGQNYVVSFKYKARPGEPAHSNGLNVTWNGVEIAPNLAFNGKWQTFAISIVFGLKNR